MNLDPLLVFDVGMHMGEDTNFYLQKGFRVVAFEANPRLVESCRVRFHDAISDGRLTILEGAIADGKSGDIIEFFQNTELSVWGTTSPKWAARNANLGAPSQKISVPLIDFAQAVRAHGVPYYLKIDIEGADELVLDHLAEFGDRPQFISIETDKTSHRAAVAQVAKLQQLGYSRFAVVEQSTIPRSTLRTQTIDGRQITHVFEEHSSGPFGTDLTSTWASAADTMRKYRRTALLHFLIGDNPALGRSFSTLVQRIFKRITSTQTPGWQDTHASR